MEDFEGLLEELYGYTLKQYDNEKLTGQESKRYVIIVDILHENNVEIPFGIEI